MTRDKEREGPEKLETDSYKKKKQKDQNIKTALSNPKSNRSCLHFFMDGEQWDIDIRCGHTPKLCKELSGVEGMELSSVSTVTDTLRVPQEETTRGRGPIAHEDAVAFFAMQQAHAIGLLLIPVGE